MTAVASPPQDMIISQPQREVLYAAYRKGLRLVHTSIQPIYGPGGRKQGEEPGVTFGFRDGILRVPTTGTVETETGRKFDAAELNAWLGEHRLFGNPFEGFMKVEQVAPPVSSGELEAVMVATASYDTDALESALEQERAGWNRVALVGAIEKSLATMASITAQVAAQNEAEAEAEKATAKKAPRA